MPERVYRVAVLSVLKHDYIPNAVAAHPRFELVAVADDPDRPDWTHQRNDLFARQHGIPYVRDVDRALADCDVAVISSEAERHCNLALRAVKAGKHIVVDKPLSPKLEECDALVTAVEQHKVKCLVWNRNLMPALVRAREYFACGDLLGELRAVHCDFYFAKDAGPRKGSRRPGDPPIDWLARQLEAHADGSDGALGLEPLGELQIEGVYPLAHLRMLAGSPVVRVFARTATHFHQAHADHDIEDLATLSLEMESGCLGSVCLGRIGAASHPNLGENKLHLVGSKGAVVINESRPEIAVHARNAPLGAFTHRRVAVENDRLLVDNFAAAIDNDGETILDAKGARDIAAIVQAALESARTNQPVNVPP